MQIVSKSWRRKWLVAVSRLLKREKWCLRGKIQMSRKLHLTKRPSGPWGNQIHQCKCLPSWRISPNPRASQKFNNQVARPSNMQITLCSFSNSNMDFQLWPELILNLKWWISRINSHLTEENRCNRSLKTDRLQLKTNQRCCSRTYLSNKTTLLLLLQSSKALSKCPKRHTNN